jgi:hypothetical protein
MARDGKRHVSGALVALLGAKAYVAPSNPDPDPDPTPTSPPNMFVDWRGGIPVEVTSASGQTSGSNYFSIASDYATSVSVTTSGSSKLSLAGGNGQGIKYVNWSGMTVGETLGITVNATATNNLGTDSASDATVIKRVS